MTKQGIIDTVIIKVTGGNPGADASVWRTDFDVVLEACINSAILEKYFSDKNEARADGIMSRGVPQELAKPFREVKVEKDKVRELDYIELPGGRNPIGGSDGVLSISPQCGCSFVKVMKSACSALKTLEKSMGSRIAYYLEGDRAYFTRSLSPYTEFLAVESVPNISELGMDEELPIPFGFEKKVLTELSLWVAEQKFGPKDYRVNEIDNING